MKNLAIRNELLAFLKKNLLTPSKLVTTHTLRVEEVYLSVKQQMRSSKGLLTLKSRDILFIITEIFITKLLLKSYLKMETMNHSITSFKNKSLVPPQVSTKVQVSQLYVLRDHHMTFIWTEENVAMRLMHLHLKFRKALDKWTSTVKISKRIIWTCKLIKTLSKQMTTWIIANKRLWMIWVYNVEKRDLMNRIEVLVTEIWSQNDND